MLPEIAPGIAGMVFTVTDFVCVADEPQALFAVTVIVPLVAPAIVLMEVVVEEPLQPAGNVHVYDVAPVTAEMLYPFALPEQTVALPVIVPGFAGRVQF